MVRRGEGKRDGDVAVEVQALSAGLSRAGRARTKTKGYWMKEGGEIQ